MEYSKALLFKSPDGGFRLAEFPLLPPGANDAVLKMKRSGICGTDLHIAERRIPMPEGEWIIGHELVGEIQELGADAKTDALGSPIAKGDKAIACVAIPCGKCLSCKSGETASCMAFGVTYVQDPKKAPHLFGGFAEALHSPAANLVKVPPGLELDSVAAFPCGGPTIIRAVEYAGGLERGELVVVQGTGSLGIFAIALAVSKGCKVVATGSGANPKRNELALRLGASEILDFRKTSVEERAAKVRAIAKEMGRGDGADAVIETSGSPQAFPEGLGLLRTRGRYLVPGQYSNSGGVQIEPQAITFRALRVIGSGQYTMKDIAAYLDFLKKNPSVAKIFAECVGRCKLQDWEAALKAAKDGLNIKTAFEG